MKKQFFAGLIVGGGLGFVIGMLVQQKRLELVFEQKIDQELGEIKAYYSAVHKPEYNSAREAAEDLIPDEVLETVQKVRDENRVVPKLPHVAYDKIREVVEPKDDVVETLPIVRNVFEEHVRDPLQAYPITKEEFLANDPEFAQATVKWYPDDNMLLDEDDDAFDDHELIVGGITEANFGVDSDSEDESFVLYVRNEKLRMDYEILLSEKSRGS